MGTSWVYRSGRCEPASRTLCVRRGVHTRRMWRPGLDHFVVVVGNLASGVHPDPPRIYTQNLEIAWSGSPRLGVADDARDWCAPPPRTVTRASVPRTSRAADKSQTLQAVARA